jgi:transcriptional regulator with XRE-family HTH domain
MVICFMDIGTRIKSLRERRNWTQRELAKRSSINVSVLNRIETGKRPVTDREITLFSDLFEVSADYLLGKTDAIDSKPDLNSIKTKKDENLYFFDMEGLTEEDIEELKKHIEFLRFKAKQYNDEK